MESGSGRVGRWWWWWWSSARGGVSRVRDSQGRGEERDGLAGSGEGGVVVEME